jgi:hypothetical protein
MPYLNWKEQKRIKQEIGPLAPGGSHEPGDKLRLTLSLESGPLLELLPLLREAFAPGGGELRLDLPRGWIVFWKRREGESRLLLAHPQTDEWVATVALSGEHGASLLERLDRLASVAPGASGPGELHLGDLAATGGVSNLELTLVHLHASGPPVS